MTKKTKKKIDGTKWSTILILILKKKTVVKPLNTFNADRLVIIHRLTKLEGGGSGLSRWQ